jgi:peptidoglycan/LPS O-acetylase OafA/YrhL
VQRGRIPVLDGWRAISILLVLGSHLLWLGPKALQLNFAAGAAGMALFFTLSGFLIVSFLYNGMTVGRFLVKRLARIVPLAWTAITILILWQGAGLQLMIRNFLFVANLPPGAFLPHGDHLWSLCVEMQFYATAALLALVAGRRGMLAIPVLCLAVTVARIVSHETISIVTWHRADEILAGGILALLHHHGLTKYLPRWSTVVAAVLLLICSHPLSGGMQYLRPYAAALLVGTTLVSAPPSLARFLSSRPMYYVASISYALYVIHWILAGTWLGSGEGLVKYLKRPLLLAATFALAHLSTRYLERPFLALSSRSRSSKSQPLPGV